MPDPLLRAVDLSRVYRRGPQEIRAVDGVDLDVADGELIAVIGASGSGKSTLLNLLAMLDTPTGGHVEAVGRRLDELSRREVAGYRAREVGMIFQSFNLLPHFSALRNVELGLTVTDAPRGERRKMATEMLTRLGLGDRLDHRPIDLSGGEQQRVAVARALVKRPRILLADEPTGNLDRENATAIADLLAELNGGGLTVVLVTHDADLAGRIADRTLRMDYGRLAEATGGRS